MIKMKSRKQKPVTLAELAKRLNLSAAAVSRALHDRESTIRVSPETVARVRALAEEMGYRPNRMARALRTGRSGMLGVICSSGMDHLMAQSLYYVRMHAERLGLLPLIHEIAGLTEDQCKLAVEIMADAKVDGVVLVRARSPVFRQFADMRIPVVGVGSPDMAGVPRFCPDGVTGMAELTRHMIDIGCRNLVLIMARAKQYVPRRIPWSLEIGFEVAVDEAKRSGIKLNGRIIDQEVEFEGMMVKGVPHIHGLNAGGYLAMKKLIEAGDIPDGVIGILDNMAFGALTACSEAGIDVIGKIAFAGTGDAPYSSSGYLPLTSLAHPLEEIHRRAFEKLQTLMETRTIGTDTLELFPCELHVRMSSAFNIGKAARPAAVAKKRR